MGGGISPAAAGKLQNIKTNVQILRSYTGKSFIYIYIFMYFIYLHFMLMSQRQLH